MHTRTPSGTACLIEGPKFEIKPWNFSYFLSFLSVFLLFRGIGTMEISHKRRFGGKPLRRKRFWMQILWEHDYHSPQQEWRQWRSLSLSYQSTPRCIKTEQVVHHWSFKIPRSPNYEVIFAIFMRKNEFLRSHSYDFIFTIFIPTIDSYLPARTKVSCGRLSVVRKTWIRITPVWSRRRQSEFVLRCVRDLRCTRTDSLDDRQILIVGRDSIVPL